MFEHNIQLSSEITDYLNTVYSQGESVNSFSYSEGDQQDRVMSEDQNKLLELTAQCINYYNRYSHEKDTHTALVGRAFLVIRGKVEQYFNRLIEQVRATEAEILQLMNREEQRLVEEKNQEEERLNYYLKQIKEVHLTKLLSKLNKDQEGYASYAQTLEGFFTVMTQVENGRFQDTLQQCLGSINTLMKKDIDRILAQNYPTKLQELVQTYRDNNPEGSFTFDQHRQTVDVPDSFLDQIQISEKVSLEEEVRGIRERQKLRESKLGLYERMLALGIGKSR